MTQYNSLNVKLSNSQLNKLKSAIKDETEAILRLSSNMIGNSDEETNSPHKLLLTNRQVANLRKSSNNLSANIKLSKSQLYKIVQSGRFLGRLLGPLLKTRLPLMKILIKPLAKNVLIPLGLIAAASAADAEIHRVKNLRFWKTTLIISRDEMEDTIKIVGVSDTIQNEAKEQKGGFLSMLLGTLGTSLLENTLAGKEINRAKDGTIRAVYGSKRFVKKIIL